MMKTARKGSDSNTNCITPRHLRKYVHLRLQLTIEENIASIDNSLHNLNYHELKNAEGEALRLCGGSA